jgi:Fe-S-cluster containining protein
MMQCKRCGTCCKKGGPSFHRQDKDLVENGLILLTDIYTIRKGEPAYDNVSMQNIYADSDIIKIKSRKGTTACIFFDECKNVCRIYSHRPVECRVLTCWDTVEIERIYSKDRLVRKDLLSQIHGLWDLIDDHQNRCSYETLRSLFESVTLNKDKAASEDIRYIVDYDTHIRHLVLEKSHMNPEMMDFLFGRCLEETIKGFGLQFKRM